MKPSKVFLLVSFLLLSAAQDAKPEDVIRIGIISTTA